MEPDVAPEGCVYVCCACGKLSQDKLGYLRISVGWDVGCTINAKLFKRSELIMNDNGLVETVRSNING